MGSNAIMGSLPASRAGAGSALNETAQQIGGAFGVAALGAVMNSIYRADVAKMPLFSSMPQEYQDMLVSSVQNAHILAEKLIADGDPETAALVLQYANQAFVDGMNHAMLIGSIIAVVALIIIIIFMPRDIHYAKEGVEADEAIKEAAAEANAETLSIGKTPKPDSIIEIGKIGEALTTPPLQLGALTKLKQT